MTKTKPKLKLKKQTVRRLKRDKRLIAGISLLALLLAFSLGNFSSRLKPYDQHPKNVVLAADAGVTIPPDLVQFLLERNVCANYRGAHTSSGVGIWAVYQVSRSRFAKISYGCSTTLSTYMMAVKENKQWKLLPPSGYFATAGYLPKCSQTDLYQIDKSIEPYCLQDNGIARDNKVL